MSRRNWTRCANRASGGGYATTRTLSCPDGRPIDPVSERDAALLARTERAVGAQHRAAWANGIRPTLSHTSFYRVLRDLVRDFLRNGGTSRLTQRQREMCLRALHETELPPPKPARQIPSAPWAHPLKPPQAAADADLTVSK